MKKGVKVLIAVGTGFVIIVAIIIVLILLKPKASEGLEFSSNGDGTCSWVGLGTCVDTEIIVPEKNGDEIVVSVEEDTLDSFDTTTVTKITLPETVKTIEEYAFRGLYSLETVVLNEGITRIENHAFSDCQNLTKINFPSTLKFIGEWAFGDCISLTEVTLPEGLTELENFAFDGCTNIKKISIPSTLNKIEFTSEKGGYCGFQFEMTNIEEFEYSGDWNYAYFQVWLDEESEETKFYYFGELVRDITKEEYPGRYLELTDVNKESIICALFNKQSLKVNGKEWTITNEKPVGIYGIPEHWGFSIQEFTEDGQLKLTYDVNMRGNIKDIVCGEYIYDENLNVYTFSESTNYEGSELFIEKSFVNFGDFLYSIEYLKLDNEEDYGVSMWVPYREEIKTFVEGDNEKIETIEEDKLEEVVNKKDDLLAELIEAFRQEGITVSVDANSGELALDSSVLFGGDSAELTSQGKEFLNQFIKVYTSVIYSDKFDGFVTETIIEGHTAPLGGSTYESGLPLSEERANNVKKYCVSSEIETDTTKLGAALEAVGCSNSKPIYDSQGAVDKEASRRVSFRFMVNLD